MLKKTVFLSLLLLNLSVTANVPSKMKFAEINVTVEQGAVPALDRIINNLAGNKAYLQALLERSAPYMPIVERILKEYNIPLDFKYLCIVESSMKGDAVSQSAAVGFWQIKEKTAIHLGLRVDNEIDERKNIEASTVAACKYLISNNRILKNWLSSLLSYLLGLSGVKTEIPPYWLGTNEIVVDESTNNYILKALAYKYVLDTELKNFKPALTLKELKVLGKSYESIAQQEKIELNFLLDFNKWQKQAVLIPSDKEYTVIVPYFRDKQNSTIAGSKDTDNQQSVLSEKKDSPTIIEPKKPIISSEVLVLSPENNKSMPMEKNTILNTKTGEVAIISQPKTKPNIMIGETIVLGEENTQEILAKSKPIEKSITTSNSKKSEGMLILTDNFNQFKVTTNKPTVSNSTVKEIKEFKKSKIEITDASNSKGFVKSEKTKSEKSKITIIDASNSKSFDKSEKSKITIIDASNSKSFDKSEKFKITIIDASNSTKVEVTKKPKNSTYFKPEGSEKTIATKIYIVKRGDTVYKIARKHRTSVFTIADLNHLRKFLIKPGQRLRLK